METAMRRREPYGYGLVAEPKASGITLGSDNRKPSHQEALMSSLDQQPRQLVQASRISNPYKHEETIASNPTPNVNKALERVFINQKLLLAKCGQSNSRGKTQQKEDEEDCICISLDLDDKAQ